MYQDSLYPPLPEYSPPILPFQNLSWILSSEGSENNSECVAGKVRFAAFLKNSYQQLLVY
jgi:hypothetical protein